MYKYKKQYYFTVPLLPCTFLFMNSWTHNRSFCCTFEKCNKKCDSTIALFKTATKSAITQSHFWKERQKVRSQNHTFEKSENVQCAKMRLPNPVLFRNLMCSKALHRAFLDLSTAPTLQGTFKENFITWVFFKFCKHYIHTFLLVSSQSKILSMVLTKIAHQVPVYPVQ